MSSHPIDAAIVDGVDVAKTDVRSYHKAYVRVTVSDASQVRNTDFSGQFGGIYVRSSNADYDLDTEDLSDDDGVNVIIDAQGNHFVRQAFEFSETQRVHTAAGAVTVAEDDADIIIVKKSVGEATTISLPSAGDRTKAVRIVDGKGDALTNNITITPQAGESIMSTADYQYVIDSNGGSIKLTPLADGSGWI